MSTVPRNKYHAKQSGKYASRREHTRAQELALLQRAGEITDLKEQVRFVLIPKQAGERAVTYTADFVYKDKSGNVHVEDSKGFKTQQYVIRRKLMLYVHGLKVEEV